MPTLPSERASSILGNPEDHLTSDGDRRLREQIRWHWDAETPRDGDGALTLAVDVVDRAEEDVRHSPEVVVAFTPENSSFSQVPRRYRCPVGDATEVVDWDSQ